MTGKHIGEFVSIGGGAKSEVWAQIKADIMGVNIKVDVYKRQVQQDKTDDGAGDGRQDVL